MSTDSGTASVTSPEIYVWHDDVHSAREGARLQFWRLSFVPEYDRPAIFESLHDLYDLFDITSYVAYEVLGDFDLLLRAWVPLEVEPEKLQLAMERALKAHSLWAIDYMTVAKTERHWIWDHDPSHRGAMRPSDFDIATVYRHHASQLDTFNTRVLESFRTPQPTLPRPPDWVAAFRAKNLLRPLPLELKGVRFFITFDHPRKSFRQADRTDALMKIRGCCEHAAARFTTEEPGPHFHWSLYSGTGPMTDFLILAGAPENHFYEFVRDLIFGIRDTTIGEQYGMRPYTHVLADRTFVELHDKPISRRRMEAARPDLLLQAESEQMEFKATYRLDLARYIATKEKVRTDKMEESVIRAVSGLLNAPAGGTLVIGALEVARAGERSKKDLEEYKASLGKEFPIEGTESPNAKALVGLEFEFGVGGFTDWDSFLRDLENTLRKRIQPLCLPFIQVDKLELKGRTLAVVSVVPSLDTWFFGESEGVYRFFVRELASTRAYDGSDGELYRRAHPRNPREP